jgi:septum formation protein
MSDPQDQHPLWLGNQPLILASGSRTRFDLLIAAGIPVQIIKANIDERELEASLEKRQTSVKQIAIQLASAKALDVSKRNLGRFVLGADQTLACAGVKLHKPINRAAAFEQIAFLSNRTHQLHSAATIVFDQKTVAHFVGTASLTMRHLSPDMIERYLDAADDAVTTSVGGYQLENLGIHLFSKITGDQSTILGLPMLKTLEAFRKLELVI